MFDKRNVVSTYIHSVTFELLKNKTSGRFVFYLTTTYQNRAPTDVKYAIPIHSIWIDDIKNEAIRCFCQVRSSRTKDLARNISATGMIGSQDKSGMCITAAGDVIRYGIKPGLTLSIEDEDYVQYSVYPSKQALILSMLETIRINGVPNAGFESANLNLIPDNLLLAFGFQKIEDYFGRGVPVWMANVSSIIEPESGRYYDRSAIRANANQLIGIISKIIESDIQLETANNG